MKPPKYIYCEYKPGKGLIETSLVWNRDVRDLEGLSDRELLEELCRRVVDYHASSLKFHDCERGTPDDVQNNDNNYCRVREVVKQVMGIDLEYVEEVNNDPQCLKETR